MGESDQKGPLEKPIDWFAGWKASFERVRQRLGTPAAVLLTLLVVGGLAWWNWDAIASRPGVSSIIDLIKRRPVPPAAAGRLTIGVVHLEGDKDREHENQLRAGLQDFEGVETLAIDRTVEWPVSGLERENRQQAEAQARRLLEQSHADVLIWGSVIKNTMRIYWTPARDVPGAKASGNYQPRSAETIALPDVFYDDLKQMLGLLSQTRVAELTDRPGRYIADRLKPLIDQVRALVQSKQGTWNAETLAGVRFALADALWHFGEQSGTPAPLEESAELYRKVLEKWTRADVPRQWALAQLRLGNALARLGEQSDSAQSGVPRLQAAADAYREALKEYTRDAAPRDWAGIQINIATTLTVLGERARDPDKLAQAVKSYGEALQVLTRDNDPADWATAHGGLGDALETLGELEDSSPRLEDAVTAYGEALKATDRARDPLEWARIQFNLGSALRALGEREKTSARLEQAADAYRAALTERTRERSARAWAITQNNLAKTLVSLGRRENGTAHLEQAVNAYRELLTEWTRESSPGDWSDTQQRIGDVLLDLADRESGTARLQQAVAAFDDALQVRTRETDPRLWAVSTGRQGVARMRLAERLGDATMAKLAVQQIETALAMLRQGGGMAAAADYFAARLTDARALAQKLAKR